ncbi:hypothetical protein TWF718_003091 [Orbilia javanica]|uniref:CENP-T/Histone H4 histone fold domain-containing protein n=1 Tax=Orbilia javanica TaxID=47235 RepID=A0AAN8MTE7_9PEZI
MADPDNYNVFAPKNALRRTPPNRNKPPSRGPTPLRSTPQASSPKDVMSMDVSPLQEQEQGRELQRPMTSPLRNLESDDTIDGPQTQPTPTTTSRHLHVSITPRASTVEPVTPSFIRTASSIPNTSVRRRLTTPHAIRGYSNRPTPHKNQGKRRNSRFAAEDDDIFQALKQFSKITAPKSKPFIHTPKAITPKAVSARRQTLEGIRLSRDLNAVSSDEETDPVRPPRLSNVSLRLIGKRLTIRDNQEAEEDDDVEISPPPQLSTPMRDSGDDDDELKSGGIETPRFEVARRAVGENDRRFSFLPNMADRFADFGDVVMDDSIVQEPGGEHVREVFEGESFAVEGEGMEGLSFADHTVDLNMAEGDVSNFFNAQGMGLPDDETDFRLEQVEISPPSEPVGNEDEDEEDLPDITNEISSIPPSPPADDLEPFMGSDFGEEEDEEDDDGPPPFQPDDDGGLRADVQPRLAKKPRGKKELPLSVHGIPYPSLSSKVIKSIIARTSKQKISKEALAMIVSASEAYFENLGEDLGSFAKHAKRKTVEEGDVLQVLRRHRLLNNKTTVFSLANQYLPRELLQDIRIQVPQKNLPKQRRRRGVDDSMADETIEEE